MYLYKLLILQYLLRRQLRSICTCLALMFKSMLHKLCINITTRPFLKQLFPTHVDRETSFTRMIIINNQP